MSSQPPTQPPSVQLTATIDERTRFGWPVVVSLVVVVFGFGGGYVRMEAFQRDVDRGIEERRSLRSDLETLRGQAAADRGRMDVSIATLSRVEKTVDRIDQTLSGAVVVRQAGGRVR